MDARALAVQRLTAGGRTSPSARGQGDHRNDRGHRETDIDDHSPACHVYEFPDFRLAFATVNHDSFGLAVSCDGRW